MRVLATLSRHKKKNQGICWAQNKWVRQRNKYCSATRPFARKSQSMEGNSSGFVALLDTTALVQPSCKARLRAAADKDGRWRQRKTLDGTYHTRISETSLEEHDCFFRHQWPPTTHHSYKRYCVNGYLGVNLILAKLAVWVDHAKCKHRQLISGYQRQL